MTTVPDQAIKIKVQAKSYQKINKMNITHESLSNLS